jgi:imidazolonepropionase-like amidohydrolase
MDTARKCLLARSFLGTIGLFIGSMLFADGEPSPGSRALALVGGRILTQTDAGTVVGTVLIRDGNIIAVGPGVAVPSDAVRIDVAGLVITPGLIDARSTLWLTAAAAREGASDGGLDVLDGIDPHDEDWKEVIRQGVTTVYVQPASSGILGGRGAVLHVGPAESLEELVLKAEAAAQAALGTEAAAPTPAVQPTLPRRRGGDPPTPEPVAQPTTAPTASGSALTRFGQYEQLKRVFETVKKYDEGWKQFEEADKTKKNASAGKPSEGKKSGEAKGASSPKPKRDGTKEFLRKVLKGEVHLRIEAHREDDVRNALRLADDFRLRVILDGVSNSLNVTESIVGRRLPLVLGPFVELEETPAYRRDRPADWPKALLAQDSRWALGTFSSQPRGSRLLRVHAAAAVARGIDPDRVLRAMTRDAAEILGVGDRLGTIAPGKRADLAVFAGDPLDPSVPVRLVVSSGKIVFQADGRPMPTQHSVLSTRYSVPNLPTRLPKKYALKTQHLLTEDGKLQPGMVLVDNGKVAGLGSVLTTGDGVPMYDLGSAVLTPGLVAAHSDLGLGSAIDDPAEANAGHVRVADVYDPQHQSIRELVKGGFTRTLFAPGSVNVIAGSCSSVRLGAMEPLFRDAGMKFVLTASSRGASRSAPDTLDDVLPAIVGRSRGGPARYPGSLAGQVELVEKVLSGKSPSTELYLPLRIRQHIQLERNRYIVALLERTQVAFFEAHTRAEIDAALQLIARFKVHGVLIGPEEIRPFLDEIKRLGVGIVARPTHVGDYDRSALELAEAAAAGVPVAFGSASAQEMRIAAALAINAGMPREAAWRGLTTAAGQMAGLPESAGRLKVGAPADLVIWDGSPLDLRSRPLCVIVDGKATQTAP